MRRIWMDIRGRFPFRYQLETLKSAGAASTTQYCMPPVDIVLFITANNLARRFNIATRITSCKAENIRS